MWDTLEAWRDWLQPSIFRAGFEIVFTLLGWPLLHDRWALTWALQRYSLPLATGTWRKCVGSFPGSRKSEGKQSVALKWPMTSGRELAEGDWAFWAQQQFGFPAVLKETKVCMLANKWDYTKHTPDGYYVLITEKTNKILQGLITAVQIMHLKGRKFNECLGNFLFKVLSLSNFVFSGFSSIFLPGTTAVSTNMQEDDYPWTNSLSVVILPAFPNPWPYLQPLLVTFGQDSTVTWTMISIMYESALK